MYEAAKYLLIASDPAARCWNQMWHVDWPYHQFPHRLGVFSHYTAHPTNPELSRYRCFASELIEFLIDDAGKAFDKPKSRTRGWDRVIQDLIDETSKARTIFMERATKKIGKPTKGSGVLFMSLPNDSSFFSILHGVKAGELIKRPDVPEAWGGDDDGGGISIIEVVIEQRES